jgi:hypothetical protein
MNGEFNETLEVIWDGKGVVARGPLEWDEEDKSVSLHVAILQNGVAAVGWTGNDIPHGADEFVVAAAVETEAKLQDGPATASGWAFVHGNGIEMYEWTVPVTLTEHGLVGVLSSGLGREAGAD